MPHDDDFIPEHPRFRLTALPSPLERAERLEGALGEDATSVPRIYLKRDDLLSLAMGGNKIRNLEFVIGAALAAGTTDVITAGRQQSNHCRLTAAACVRAGLRAHLVLSGVRPDRFTGNLLLDDLFGAAIHFTGSDDRAARTETVAKTAERLLAGGLRPFLIPVGGSDALGALGHVLAAREIVQQCDSMGERPTAIVLATATGGTQAGLLAGLRKLGSPAGVIGFAVAKTAPELQSDVLAIANELSREMALPTFAADGVAVDASQIAAGYGAPSRAGNAAVELLARTEGVLADPVYTGKALAGFFELIRAGRFSSDDAVIFVHTGGGPALFADLPATAL